MSAMNSAAIVEGFRSEVPEEVLRVKARFGELIRESIRMSGTVEVPDDLRPSGKYDALRRGQAAKPRAEVVVAQRRLTDERVREAADLLFSSYD